MKINRGNIIEAFKIFRNVYPEFEKKMENKNKAKEMIDTWIEVFEAVDFDYQEVNKDFLIAVKRVITKCKYIPTIAEVTEEMRSIYEERREERKMQNIFEINKLKQVYSLQHNNFDKAITFYERLKEKYSTEQIEKFVKETCGEMRNPNGKFIEEIFIEMWDKNE